MQNGHYTKDLKTVGALAANECKGEQCELHAHSAGDLLGQKRQLFFLFLIKNAIRYDVTSRLHIEALT